MHILLLQQYKLCLSGIVEINFCLTFERYDLTNGVTSAPKIWYTTPTSNYIQDPTVESTKEAFKND